MSDSENNDIFVITPAGMLVAHGFNKPDAKDAIRRLTNCLINEAAAARDVLVVTPSSGGGGEISIRSDCDPLHVQRYGECREDTEDAARNAGFSIETLRHIDVTPEDVADIEDAD